MVSAHRNRCNQNFFLYFAGFLQARNTSVASMPFEDMLSHWENFNLTAEEEGTEVDVDRQVAEVTSRSLGFSLIGKLLSPRFIAGDVMRKNFKSAWNIPEGLTVEKLRPNLFLFSLRSEEE